MAEVTYRIVYRALIRNRTEKGGDFLCAQDGPNGGEHTPTGHQPQLLLNSPDGQGPNFQKQKGERNKNDT
jgi:hypothetical protein